MFHDHGDHDHGNDHGTPEPGTPNARRARLAVRFALAGLVAAGAVFASASVMVTAGQATVITRFGDLSRVLVEPGLAWKLPTPIESVIPVDLRLRTSSTGLQDVGTKDGLRILVQAYVAWQVPADPDRIRQFLRAEPTPTPDQQTFSAQHGSDNATYAQVSALLKTQVVSFPQSRAADDALFTLADAYGPGGAQIVEQIVQSGRIVLHAVGDTGSSDVRRYHDEQRVADQVTTDAYTTEVSNRPSCFFHLGDVVYNFGEARYYYDQFYEPYRAYPAPILAIAGNHDSFVLPDTQAGETPLDVFTRNFCSPAVTTTGEAGSLHRTAMTQPGVYFGFDAPFIRIIALFSNALEDPGTLSSEGGRWPGVPDYQLGFLRAQLERIRREDYRGAVVIATHHPPFVYSPPPASAGAAANHGSSIEMLHEIDTICAEVGVYPHAFLAAHAHCYQRFTRMISMGDSQHRVPFVVCGNGGHNINPLVRSTRGHPAPEPENGADVSYLDRNPALTAASLHLEKYDDHDYGYLRISADAKQLRIAYHQCGTRSLLQSRYDLVTVDLASHQLLANGS